MSRLTSGIIFSASMKPRGMGGVVSSSISAASSSRCVDTQRQTNPRHRAVDVRGHRHRVIARLLEQQTRAAAWRLGDAIDERGNLEVRIDRLR